MSDKVKNAMNKTESKGEQYVRMIFSTLKRCGHLEFSAKNANFSDTEMRLIGEVVMAKYRGERLISTQIAKRLGLTRSAISQIVNRLEAQGVVKRVPDDVDKKIAYIETTEEMAEKYRCDAKRIEDFIGKLVEEFGEDDFFKMCDLLNRFLKDLEEARSELN